MKNLKKKACKLLSVAMSAIMVATAFTGFAATSVGAATIVDQSGNFICTDLEDGTIEITGCVVNGDVDIPSEINGKKVTSIGKYAFKDGVTNVSIPESVVTIKEKAFEGCYSLEKVDFSEGLKYIGKDAFSYCNIQRLNFPETLKEIDDNAFMGNYSLTDINFPKTRGVKLGYYAFDRGSWYWSNPDGPIISGKTFLCYKAYGTYIEEYTIPNGIESINCFAFSDLYSVSKINIPDSVKYIGAAAFSNTNISEIVIPYGVESIEKETFYNCNNLETVTIPDTVTSIGDSAFSNCPSLTGSFIVPESVTYIGNYAFNYSNISELVLPENNNLTFFGENALCETEWFNAQPDGPMYLDDIFIGIKQNEGEMPDEVNIKDGTKIVACSALSEFDGDITVADSVKYINDHAFANTYISQNEIPANVEVIGDSAFDSCECISEFKVPSTLKVIEDYAFDNCTNLSSVYNTNSLISIGDYAFRDSNVKTLHIGPNLKEFGVAVFEANEVLESFTVDKNNKYFSAKNGILYNKDQTVMICYPPAKKTTKLIVTQDILDFKDAFLCGNAYITEIVIEEGVLTIPSYAFINLPNVEIITIPSTVTKIGEYILDISSALHTVNFNAIDSKSDRAFMECENITTVNFGPKVTNVSYSMFEYCTNLTDINFSGNIERIDQYAFNETAWDSNIRSNCADGEIVYVDKVAYCSNYPTGDITIKDGTKSIYSKAFYECSEITSVTLPDSVETIGFDAFGYCGMNTIKMSENIERIEDNAFRYCHNLKAIDLGNKLTYLGNSAFNCCNSLESITIPSGVDVIRDNTFQSCSSLKSVTLNDGLEYIGYCAFGYIENLESIKLPSTVKEIASYAFSGTGLKTVELNEGLQTIDSNAFNYSYELESINFPSTLKKIGSEAFYQCASLKNAVLNEGLETLEDYVFSYCELLENVVIPSTLNTIGYSTFEYCYSLNNVVLNEGLERIGAYAFYSCTDLESITLPSTVKELEYSALSYCTSLKEVNLNEGLEYIGTSAFTSSAIESIELPSTLKEVNYGLFSSCELLESVTLKEGLTSICNGAFYNCPNFTEITIPSTVKYIDSSVFDNNMTIHGYKNSYAQEYVENHLYDDGYTHTFVAIARKMGDVNSDGIVNVTDATDLQKYIADMKTLTQKQLACADVTSNGNIDIKDVSYIMKALVGVCEL